MSHIVRNVLLAAAALSVALVAATPASADWRRPYHRHYHGPVHHGDEALALGLFGLAAGAIAGAAIAGASEPRYVRRGYVYPDYPVRVGPPPDLAYDTDAYPPAPAGRSYGQRQYGLTPWSPEWYRYCANRYRSFNPRSGTYIGYDNQAHFCTAG